LCYNRYINVASAAFVNVGQFVKQGRETRNLLANINKNLANFNACKKAPEGAFIVWLASQD
jgi:hypothetical protein